MTTSRSPKLKVILQVPPFPLQDWREPVTPEFAV